MKYRLLGSNDYLINPVITVLNNRGITDTDKFLNLTIKDTHCFHKLKNIDAAVDCLLYHIKQKSTIFIQVDSDCDGVTSSAILYNYLKKYDKTINIKYRLHNGKEHGIILGNIPDDVKLVIIPDAGSNQYNEHAELKAKGIDVIVLDHHLTDRESKHAIVVNNHLSPDYPNKNFSGVGIVYKFCQALDERLGINQADEYLDLVALGNIADVIDTREPETRYYILEGLKNIKNPFIKAMITKQSYSIGNTITITSIAFYIVPLINACIRFGKQEDKENMFKAFIDVNREEMVEYKKRGAKEAELVPLVDNMARECVNIKNRQGTARDKGVAAIEDRIKEKNLLDNKILIVNCTGILEQTLTGLVATQLANRYKRPVILLRYRKDVTYGGSARGYDKSEIKDFRQFLRDTKKFSLLEGHSNAFGIEIESTKLVELNNMVNEILKDYVFEDIYEVDFIVPAAQINPNLIKDIDSLKHVWGQGVNEPYIAIKDLIVDRNSIKLMGKTGNTIKFNYRGVDFIKFFTDEEEYNKLTEFRSTNFEIIGKCSVNEWQGRITPQIIIEDYNYTESNEFIF